MARRFFADDSFWNTPLPDKPEIDPFSDTMIALLKTERNGPFGVNLHQWTIPIYEVDAQTPRRKVHRRVHTEADLKKRKSKWIGVGHRFGHGAEFAADALGVGIPIPEAVAADPEDDAHLALVDWAAGVAWDMWGARRRADGDWESNTGMKYAIAGPGASGVFRTDQFPGLQDGDSIHFHGPSRAAGVPAIVGTILHDEVVEGEIRHKLGCATRFNAFQQFVFPACWTDGHRKVGIPEGAIIQLDPALDLDRFGLTPAAKTVCRAMQVYGAVNVDNAGGTALYGEGLWAKPGKSWKGLLEPLDTQKIPMDHYRVLKLENIVHRGDSMRSGKGA
ncbi:MAG TPA: hypothetical protein VL860_00200 [Planctomycetota bacterium]|nr:hypothetical protein [Planctomycetota bacterium]